MNSAREDRNNRLRNPQGAVIASSSQDIIYLVTLLFSHSVDYAKSIDGNCSIYTIAGIPLLFSTLRALLIEANDGMYNMVIGKDKRFLIDLTKQNETILLQKKYNLKPELFEKLELLYEVRNEIVHPTHLTSRTPNNTPKTMTVLREMQLLNSTSKSESDYDWIQQLKSHKLFIWAFSVIEEVATVILKYHFANNDRLCGEFLKSYSIYKRLQ